MKKLLSTSLLALVAASVGFPALAADLPSHKAPVVTAPPQMWTGFYAGLNAGYNFGTNSNVYSQNWGGNWVELGVPVLPGTALISMDAFASNT